MLERWDPDVRYVSTRVKYSCRWSGGADPIRGEHGLGVVTAVCRSFEVHCEPVGVLVARGGGGLTLGLLGGERGVAHAEAEVLDVVEGLVEEFGDVVVVEGVDD